MMQTIRQWPAGLGVGALLLCGASAPAAAQAARVEELPAQFVEGRIYVRPVTPAGDTLVFYTDTGGGLDRLYTYVVDRLGLTLTPRVAGTDTLSFAAWPQWRPDAAIPGASDVSGFTGGQLAAFPFGRETAMVQDSGEAGFLGARWFADRVWTFDYPAGRLLLRAPGDLPEHEPRQRVALGFHVDSAGRRTTHFPRIRVSVAGDSLDLLFDTGATMVLTDSARALLGDRRPARRAASFISAAVFDRWRAAHPDWRVIERATTFGAPMIEVPEIEIAGERIGPVWFEARRTGVFEEWMSQWMDRPIAGALGGNALQFFRVTADYPNSVAVFEKGQR